MQGSLQNPPIVVYGSRARGVLFFVGGAVFVIGCAFGLTQGFQAALAMGIVLFGLGAAMGLALLIWPSTLEISPEGIRQHYLWTRRQYAWTDIHDFRTATIGFNNRAVGFDFVAPRPDKEGLRQLNTAIAGVQGTLQMGWELKPDKLAALLNESREHWLNGAQGVPSDAAALPATPRSRFAGARMGRKGYWIVAGVLFGVAIVISLIPGMRPGGSFAGLLLIWLYGSRLHDIGRSAWWQLPLYAAQLVVIFALAGAGGESIGIGIAVLMQLVFTITLGVIPGQPGENRFGRAPGQPSAAGSAEVFR